MTDGPAPNAALIDNAIPDKANAIRTNATSTGSDLDTGKMTASESTT
jgi:hypothetical protein